MLLWVPENNLWTVIHCGKLPEIALNIFKISYAEYVILASNIWHGIEEAHPLQKKKNSEQVSYMMSNCHLDMQYNK